MLKNPIIDRLKNLAQRLGLVAPFGNAIGSQRPLRDRWMGTGDPDSIIGRNYDLEIPLSGGLIRDPDGLRTLIEMRTYCPEVETAISVLRDDAFSSEHGDDQGVSVSKFLDNNEELPDEQRTPIDSNIKSILDDFIYKHLTAEFCKPILEETLTTGDSFVEIVFNSSLTEIVELLRLPVGEMFRVELSKGQLVQFEQRGQSNIWNTDSYKILYAPMQIIHWRYKKVHLYGRSLYAAAKNDWDDLKLAEQDLAKACRDLGVIPVHHEMPEKTDRTFRDLYQQEHIRQKQSFLVTDLYTMPGVKISRIASAQANLDPLFDRVIMRRLRIAMTCRVPESLMSVGHGFSSGKELSNQPATAYARHLAAVRQSHAQGLNQILDTVLALKGINPADRQYRLVFPKIVTNPYNQSIDQTRRIV